MTPRHPPRNARGAALLMAMIIVALVATLASAMVWQQWRTVQIETAERARAQSSWILTGALDWSELILREDARADFNKSQGPNPSRPYDGLDEPWATPLAEARLSTFLAADENYTGDGPEAFLSGEIADAQSRFNIMNLVEFNQDNIPVINREQETALKALCNSLEVVDATATRIAQGMVDAESVDKPNAISNPPIRPARIDQLVWFGIDPNTLKRLEPYLVMFDPLKGTLPTPINVNTASSEVIAAVLGVNRAEAERVVQERKNKPLRDRGDVLKLVTVPQTNPPKDLNKLIDVRSSYYEVRGRMRIGDRTLEQKALVHRDNTQRPYTTTVMVREDIALKDAGQ